MSDSGNSAAGLLEALPLAPPRRLVGVQFRRAAAMIYDFDAAGLQLPHDSRVVVETERGEALGWTVGEPEERDPHSEGSAVRRILRVADGSDEERRRQWQGREQEALRFCARRARELNLPMKVISVEWVHSGEKAAFYFSSEERVDFRTLVRDLAQWFRVRVEMRQVGPRDEAKIIGALGPCGRETCCSSWMRAFTPVSIKMAKDQGLAISPAKVTGVCGRLLCCLAFEEETYRDLRRKLPRYGKQVETPRGPGRIIDVLVLRERVRVALDRESEWVELAASEVRPLGAAAAVEEPETEVEDATGDEIPVEAPAASAALPAPVERRFGEQRERGRPQAAPPPRRDPSRQERRDSRRDAQARPPGGKPLAPAASGPSEARPAQARPAEARPAETRPAQTPRAERPPRPERHQHPRRLQPPAPEGLRPPPAPAAPPAPVSATPSAAAPPAGAAPPRVDAQPGGGRHHRHRQRSRGRRGPGEGPGDGGAPPVS